MKYKQITFTDRFSGNMTRAPIISYSCDKKETDIETLSFPYLVQVIEMFLVDEGVNTDTVAAVLSTMEFWYKKQLEFVLFHGNKDVS